MTDEERQPARHRAAAAGPVVAIARSEIRSRWLGLVLIGLLAGVVGAVAISGVALARRTTTAYDRLGEVTKVDDARGTVVRHRDLIDDIVDLPMVTDSWTGGIAIGRVEGENIFIGITAGPRDPTAIIDPIVLEGRLPKPSSDPDVIEVALGEEFQRDADVPMGSEFPVRFLTEADFFRFDTGFEGGDVHGPEAVVRVVGTLRMAGGDSTVPQAFADASVLESHPDAFVGSAYFVQLEGGSSEFDDFAAAVEGLAGDRTLPPEAAEFPVADVSGTAVAAAAVDNTALLLGRALMVFALSAGVVGGFAVVQAVARHHTASARTREVEQALGLTRGQQTAARLLAGLIPAVLATIVAGAGALAAARIEPIGAIDLYEPSPGAAVNVAVLALGLAVVLVGVLAAAAADGGSEAAPIGAVGPRKSSVVARVTRVGGSPPIVLGLRFALEPGRGARAVPIRSAVTGAVVGLAGVVAGLVFVSSLDRLITSPVRSAVPFDAFIADVTEDALVGEVLDHPVVGDVSLVASAPIVLEGLTLDAHAVEDIRGSLDIGVDEGRLPRTPDEIALGLRVARDLDVGAGDTVTVRRPDGEERDLAVVGLAVVPTFSSGGELGLNALLTPEGLEANATSAAFTGAGVEVAPGGDVDELLELLSSRFEADAQAVPVSVQNLEQLGGLPAAVAALVGSIAVLALANALVVAVRRRRGDLAVLRAIGFTRRQTASSVVVMALAIVAIGVVVGVPVGIAIGSTLWRATASGAFVLSEAYVRWELVLLPVVGAAVIALIAASLPARQAATQSPAEGLRVE